MNRFPDMTRAEAIKLIGHVAAKAPDDLTVIDGVHAILDATLECWPKLNAMQQSSLLGGIGLIVAKLADGAALDSLGKETRQ